MGFLACIKCKIAARCPCVLGKITLTEIGIFYTSLCLIGAIELVSALLRGRASALSASVGYQVVKMWSRADSTKGGVTMYEKSATTKSVKRGVLLAAILAMLASMLCFTGIAQAEDGTYFGEDEVPNYRGRVFSDHAVIERYIGDEVNVVIPGSVKGKPVTEIGSDAFKRDYFDWRYDDPESYEDSKLAAVTIPATVTKIGEWAFNNNPNLKTVTYENTLIEFTVGERAFGDCGFATVEIPYNMRFTEGNPFAGCPIQQFSVAYGHPQLEAIDKGRLLVNPEGDTALLFANSSVAGTYKIPSQVKIVGDGAFVGAQFKTLKLNKVVEVKEEGFKNCDNLKVLDLSKSLKKIGAYGFHSCRQLNEVNLPAGAKLKSIGAFAFFNDLELLSFYVPKTVKKIGGEALGFYSTEEDDAVVGSFCLTVEKGTAGLKYAKANGIYYIGSTKVTKLVSAKKSLRVTMKKPLYQPYTKKNKFQIGYRVKGTSKWKTKKTPYRTATIGGLKKGKRYEVRVRAMKWSGTGAKLYGAWSPIKVSKKVK